MKNNRNRLFSNGLFYIVVFLLLLWGINWALGGSSNSGCGAGIGGGGNLSGAGAGGTITISGGTVNDGIYVIKEVQPDGLTLNRYLDAADGMTVTKVQYPPDVVQCAVSLFNWKETMGAKVGIKSETLSRHSVTYEDSGTGLFMGYPLAILSGLKLYRKARC